MITRRNVIGGLTLPAVLGAPPSVLAEQSAPPLLKKTWSQFSEKFIHADGRVKDNYQNGITHTEGLGVAMLAAQACDDWKRFEKMYACSKKLLRPDGLYSWSMSPEGKVLDPNNASDGDLYVAWALLRAGLKALKEEWLVAANRGTQAMLSEVVRKAPQGTVLIPAKFGFIEKDGNGKEVFVTNPSYWVFPAIQELQKIPRASAWAEVLNDTLNITAYARFGDYGLPADWVVLTDPVAPWDKRPARFGYESVRVALFLAWAQQDSHPALRACAKFMQTPNFPAWVGFKGNEKAEYPAPAGFEAIARLCRKAVYGTPFELPALDQDYFSSSLVLLSALAAHDRGWL